MKVGIFLSFVGISTAILHLRTLYQDQSALKQMLSSRDLKGLADGDGGLVLLERRTKDSPNRGSPNTPTSPPFARGFLDRKKSGSSPGQGSSKQSSCQGSTKESPCQGSSKDSPGQGSAKGSTGQESMIGSPSQGSAKGSPKKAAFSPGFLKTGFSNQDPENEKRPKSLRMSSRRRPQKSLNDFELKNRYTMLAGGWPKGDTHNTALNAQYDLHISKQKQAKSKELRLEEDKYAKKAYEDMEMNPNSPALHRKTNDYRKTFEKSQQGLQDYSDAAKQSSKSSFLHGQYNQAVNQMKKSIRADTRKATREDYSKVIANRFHYVNLEQEREGIKGSAAFNNNFRANMAKDSYGKATDKYRNTFAAGQTKFEELSGSSSSEDDRDYFRDVERKTPPASPQMH